MELSAGPGSPSSPAAPARPEQLQPWHQTHPQEQGWEWPRQGQDMGSWVSPAGQKPWLLPNPAAASMRQRLATPSRCGGLCLEEACRAEMGCWKSHWKWEGQPDPVVHSGPGTVWAVQEISSVELVSFSSFCITYCCTERKQSGLVKAKFLFTLCLTWSQMSWTKPGGSCKVSGPSSQDCHYWHCHHSHTSTNRRPICTFKPLKSLPEYSFLVGFPIRWNTKDKSNSKAWSILFFPTFYY